MDSADSVHASLGYLLPVQAFRKTMDREGQKGTTLIITSVRMPMLPGAGWGPCRHGMSVLCRKPILPTLHPVQESAIVGSFLVIPASFSGHPQVLTSGLVPGPMKTSPSINLSSSTSRRQWIGAGSAAGGLWCLVIRMTHESCLSNMLDVLTQTFLIIASCCKGLSNM